MYFYISPKHFTFMTPKHFFKYIHKEYEGAPAKMTLKYIYVCSDVHTLTVWAQKTEEAVARWEQLHGV